MKPHLLRHTRLLLLFAFVMLFNGCVKEDDFRMDKVAQGEWSPELAIPLINSSLSLNDIISVSDNSLFNISNHRLSLIYKTNIYTQYGYQFFEPVSTSNALTLQVFPPDSMTLYQSGTVSRSINAVFPLTFPNGEQIDSLTFRKGAMRIDIASAVPHPGILNISIPSATLNGQPFSKDIPFSAANGSTQISQDIFDMSNYNMSTKNAGMPNMLGIIYTLTFNNSGTTSPTLNKNFDITLSFDSITPASMFGYFGQSEFLAPVDTAEIGIFSNFQSGSIYFDDPIMTFSLSNSFGMPIDANITSLLAVKNDGTSIPLTGPYPSPMIDFPAAYGQTATNSFVFDKSNSNIQQIFNSAPQYIIYNIQAGTNLPLPTYNFMGDSSVFKADLQVEFPMKGYASGFTIQDTVDFSLGDIDMISSVNLRLNISNGFPVHANTQLYLADENYNIIDSVLTVSQNKLIEAAQIDNAGRATVPTVRMTDELFEGDRLQHLFNSKKILIKATIETKDAPNSVVEIYDDYKLGFKIGVKTKLKIDY